MSWWSKKCHNEIWSMFLQRNKIIRLELGKLKRLSNKKGSSKKPAKKDTKSAKPGSKDSQKKWNVQMPSFIVRFEEELQNDFWIFVRKRSINGDSNSVDSCSFSSSIPVVQPQPVSSKIQQFTLRTTWKEVNALIRRYHIWQFYNS